MCSYLFCSTTIIHIYHVFGGIVLQCATCLEDVSIGYDQSLLKGIVVGHY
jgi:hypothetical protein